MKRLIVLLALSLSIFAQIIPKNIARVTGNGIATAVGTGSAIWVSFTAQSDNVSHVYIGTSTVSSTNAVYDIAPGGSAFLPVVQSRPTGYLLTNWYYIVASNDHLAVGWGQ